MTIAKTPAREQTPSLQYRLVLDFRAVDLTHDQLLQLCLDNGDFRIELSATKELIVMPPTWSFTGWRNSRLNQQLSNWSDTNREGLVFDSSSGFILPNGALRAPDVSWISLARWRALTDEQLEGFSNICPDFVIELRSSSDKLADLQAKMAEYMENGARLGWVVDAQTQQVHVLPPGPGCPGAERPGFNIRRSGASGFCTRLTRIW